MTLHAYISNHPLGNVHDPKYLSNAITSNKWLKANGLFNSQGLYADGFHIRGWRGETNPSNGTGKCDMRDKKKVYTHN